MASRSRSTTTREVPPGPSRAGSADRQLGRPDRQEEDQQRQQTDQDTPPTGRPASRSRPSPSTTRSARAPAARPCCRCCSTTTTRTATCSWSTSVDAIDDEHRPHRPGHQQPAAADHADVDGATGRSVSGTRSPTGAAGRRSATVTVTVRLPGENSPPQQVRATRTTVAQGGRVSTQVARGLGRSRR